MNNKRRIAIFSILLGGYLLASLAHSVENGLLPKQYTPHLAPNIQQPPQPPLPTEDPQAENPDEEAQSALVDYDADVMRNRGDGITRLLGNVRFHHNGAIIQCDSALQYPNDRMEFFGNVIIEKDSALVYGDKVFYDGNTNLADVYAPIVKMMRGDATLYSYNLQFDTETSIGVFHSGGVLNQKENLIEAQRGSFDADKNYVKFQDSVAARNLDYTIKTDSLGFSIDAEQLDFLTRTYIWDDQRDFLQADSGHYFSVTKSYLFYGDSYILTPDNEMWSDTLRYLTELKQAYLFSNVQILDSANNTLAFGDWGFYDDSLKRAVLTRTPSVRMWDSVQQPAAPTPPITPIDTTLTLAQQDSIAKENMTQDSITRNSFFLPNNSEPQTEYDTTYMRGDTIMFLTLPMESVDSLELEDGAVVADSIITSGGEVASTDSVQQVLEQGALDSLANFTPSDVTLSPHNSALPTALDTLIVPDTLAMMAAADSMAIVADSIVMDTIAVNSVAVDTTALGTMILDSMAVDAVAQDSMILDSVAIDTTALGTMILDSMAVDALATDSLPQQEPEQPRLIKAYHNVKIWNDGYQAVSDSVVGYTRDSSMMMFGEPVLWSENNQITSDQVELYTNDSELDWAYFAPNAFIAQQLRQGDTMLFNQASATELETYFTNNDLDYSLMKGNVQNIYYMTEGQDVTALAAIESAELTMIFKNREPVRMVWGGSGSGPIYPMDKIPETQPRFLEGFSWRENLRPQKAQQICTRTEKPSRRAEVQEIGKPLFDILQVMNENKAKFMQEGIWMDRVEWPEVTPEYFTERNERLLF